MTLLIFGKDGCGICAAAAAKLDLLGIAYEKRTLEAAIQPHDGWRVDGTVELLAAYAREQQHIPILKVGETYMGYAAAMKALKEVKA